MTSASPSVLSANPARTRDAGRRLPALRPARIATANMLSESGASVRPACIALYSSVICRKIGRTIIAPPRVICWSICWEIPILKCGNAKSWGSSRVTFPCRFRRTSHQARSASPDGADRHQQADRLAAFLPDEDAEDEAAHADDGENRTCPVDLAGPRVGDVLDELDSAEDAENDQILEQEADAPRQIRGDETAEQRPDRRGDRGRGADQRVGPLPGGALEVSVNQGLHRRQQKRRAEAPEDRPEDDDRDQVLGERHRQRADRVAQQAEHVRPPSPDQVTDLAGDQDERGRHERLERDRGLDTADGRVQVVNHRRDRDIHQRCVDNEHEHRHREEERQQAAALRRFGLCGACSFGYSAA